MTLPSGTVYVELAPRFAPRHAANIRTLVAQHYFDGLAVLRVQDNFVAQWGDPDAESEAPPGAAPAPDSPKARSLGAAAATLPPEFSIDARGLGHRQAEGPRRLGAGHRFRRRLSGRCRPEDESRLDRPLLRHRRRGPGRHRR
jgi:hypothetical protein